MKFCSSVVLNEWNHYYNILFLLDACIGNKETFSIEKFFKETRDILNQNFEKSKLFEYNINFSTKPSEVNNNFKKILNNLT